MGNVISSLSCTCRSNNSTIRSSNLGGQSLKFLASHSFQFLSLDVSVLPAFGAYGHLEIQTVEQLTLPRYLQ